MVCPKNKLILGARSCDNLNLTGAALNSVLCSAASGLPTPDAVLIETAGIDAFFTSASLWPNALGSRLKPSNIRIALLIDCDNVSCNSIEGVLAELAKHGIVNVRHAHGDWKSNYLVGWIEKLHPNAVRPIQQFAYTTGKNATDSAMIIDAMDLLYSKNIDAFALMTSDSDFTPLVLRILESGMPVFGFGEKKTPMAFVHACSQFIYIENLIAQPEAKRDEPESAARLALIQDEGLIQLLRTAVDQTSEDDSWSSLSKVGKYISNTSSFSPINYGFRKLSEVLRASELFEVEMRSENTAMYVKARGPISQRPAPPAKAQKR